MAETAELNSKMEPLSEKMRNLQLPWKIKRPYMLYTFKAF
jgi:hypothetical protein